MSVVSNGRVMKAYWKDVFREIKHSATRFFSLLIISTLGAMSIVGIYGTAIDMRLLANASYQQQALYDLHIKSTVGFTQDDITALKQNVAVKTMEATYSCDVYLYHNERMLTLRTHALPENLNKIDLVRGNLPQSAAECLVDQKLIDYGHYQLGDKINLGLDKMDDYYKFFSSPTFTIVGIVASPLYINSHDLGSTQLGDGRLNFYLYLAKDAYQLEVFTDIYVTLEATANIDNLSARYFNTVAEQIKFITDLGTQLVDSKIAEYRSLQETIDEAWREYAAGEKRLSTELHKAQNKLRKTKKKLQSAKMLLLASQINRDNMILSSQQEIDLKAAELANAQDSLDAYRSFLQNSQHEIDYNRQELNAALALLQAQGPYGTSPELDSQYAAIYQGLDHLALLQSEIDNSWLEVATQQNTIDQARQLLELAQATLNDMAQESQNKIDENWSLYYSGFAKYRQGLSALKSEEIKNYRDLQKARDLIEEAQDALDQAPQPEWFYFSRQDGTAFYSYYQDTYRLQKVGRVLPLMFLAVALLMSTTTMTRMVQERRPQIGIYKALGYSAFKIMLKYLIYAFSVSFLGGILGVVLGSTIIPRVIYGAYSHLYVMAPLVTPIPLFVSAVAVVSSITAVLLMTWLSFSQTIQEVPAELMRPKAPAKGKRIILERLSGFWSKLDFISKVTIRNVFRYKKRVFMTLSGVAGCTALILTAFGLKDSISAIASQQYDRIIAYNSIIYIKDSATPQEKDKLTELINGEYLFVYTKATDVQTTSGNMSAFVVVPQDPAKFSGFIKLYDRFTKAVIPLNNDGAVISEKIARAANLKVGDTLSFSLGEGRTYNLAVKAIVENYVFHYIYLTPQTYENLLGEAPLFNNLYVKTTSIDETASNLLTQDYVRGVMKTPDIKDNINNSTDALQAVTLILIIIACALALVVLFNITNLNITERNRELATIKVLGFYDTELVRYIYRETIAVTLSGIICGLIAGVFLHRYILSTIEIDMLVFPELINPPSYLYAIVLSTTFAMFVNLIMSFKLRRIDMVASLKSIE